MRRLAPRFMPLAMAACFTPTAGDYAFTVTSEETDCPADFKATTGQAEVISIGVDMDVPELVLAGAPEEHCPLSGMDFTCEYAEVDDEIDYSGDGYVAVYTIDMDMKGTFIVPNTMNGTTSTLMSCIGADCASMAEELGNPACLVTWYWEASTGG
ncbi:hypothetical protein LBMAG42_28250 [Deltaproteobacteria bacterium]|nr:hypothetical protein LBMAG42_28250 [Deltaproteobacteria bacterium]